METMKITPKLLEYAQEYRDILKVWKKTRERKYRLREIEENIEKTEGQSPEFWKALDKYLKASDTFRLVDFEKYCEETHLQTHRMYKKVHEYLNETYNQ